MKKNAEQIRLDQNYSNEKNWLKWGPYLSERQWGTVREDYSKDSQPWSFFTHEHSRSRLYRWGEDGLAGICDEKCRLCFAITLWNGKDPILKERLFGLTGPEGNHGEDCKELYFYLDSTPTHSYMKHLYKYPLQEFPYRKLVSENAQRSRNESEYEILDTRVFDDQRYFDVFTEYAKADEDDVLIRITIHNRYADVADIHLLPTLWFRNEWLFGKVDQKPSISVCENHDNFGCIKASHDKLGDYYLYFEKSEKVLFTENETNAEKMFGIPNESPFVKDAFHKAIIKNQSDVFEQKTEGTKFAPVYYRKIAGEQHVEVRLRLCKKENLPDPLGQDFETLFSTRLKEANEFYDHFAPKTPSEDLSNIQRQAFAGLMWTKQYYNLDVDLWLDGDPNIIPPPHERKSGRNHDWRTLNNEDIISMPDKWEYPWYAAWDLAFHCIPMAMIDPEFAKNQIILLLREWYMNPSGQIPAYEWSFSDVNPPVHAWATIRIFEIDKKKNGKGDINFLKRVFHKLLLNFTWWVNRKDHNDNNIFEGGFLGLDNIGVFDRSSKIPGDGHLEQADGTAWMAMYCLNMLQIAIEIALEDPAYEDVTTKFFEHFVYITESINQLTEEWAGTWDEEEGFFYDLLILPNDKYIPLKVRSLVGLTTLFAVLVLEKDKLDKLKNFKERLTNFRNYRIKNAKYLAIEELNEDRDLLLSLVPKERLKRILKALLDENEFLSPGGIRSLSKLHKKPYTVSINDRSFGLKYEPGESSTDLFGGNSNWRGPVWFPMNYMIIESLREYYRYYEDQFQIAFPTGQDKKENLEQVAEDISDRLIRIFQKDENGIRPVNGHYEIFRKDPYFKDLVLFYEYFHGDNSRGMGASHQTGWTALIAELIDKEYW